MLLLNSERFYTPSYMGRLGILPCCAAGDGNGFCDFLRRPSPHLWAALHSHVHSHSSPGKREREMWVRARFRWERASCGWELTHVYGHSFTCVVSLSASTFSFSVVSPVPVRSKGTSALPHLCLTNEKERKYAGENLCFKKMFIAHLM